MDSQIFVFQVAKEIRYSTKFRVMEQFDQHGVKQKLNEFWMYKVTREHTKNQTMEFAFEMKRELLCARIWLYETQE